MNNEYLVGYVDFKPWKIIWYYKNGKMLAHYSAHIDDIGKSVKEVKPRKIWTCEVCNKTIEKCDTAIKIRLGGYDFYTHKGCIRISNHGW